MDKTKKVRYVFSVFMVMLMVGIAEWTGEKEIIFPEMAALAVGLWVIDKRVWKVGRWQLIELMTAGAVAGVCIVRYSTLPLLCNLCLAFAFAACCLLFSRATLIPLISACMLPVLLHTETWIYPSAVFLLSAVLVAGQRLMEKGGLRRETDYVLPGREWKKEIFRWAALLFWVSLVAALSISCECSYFIIPPLIVTFTEIVNQFESRIQKPPHAGVSVFGYRSCLGDRFSDHRAYLFAFARDGGRLAHHLLLVCCLRVDRKVLCSRRSIGVDPSDSPARGCALAASASCCGRCPVHRYRYACVPAMLQVE